MQRTPLTLRLKHTTSDPKADALFGEAVQWSRTPTCHQWPSATRGGTLRTVLSFEHRTDNETPLPNVHDPPFMTKDKSSKPALQPVDIVSQVNNKSPVPLKQLSILDFVACGPLHAVETETTTLDETGHVNTMEEFNLLSELDNVVNLSNHTLSDAEKSVLKNGLKFCPTPGEPVMGETRRDLDRFHRSLRLKCHFGKDHIETVRDNSIGPFNNTRDLKLKSRSTWIPPIGSSNLETVININELGLLATKITPR